MGKSTVVTNENIDENELRILQKEEAMARLNILSVMDDVKELFKKNNRLYYSERQNKIFKAVLYFVEAQEFIDKIRSFEKSNKALVYHVQLTHTEFGDSYSLLYVSNNTNEWESDKEDLRNGDAYAMVWNNEVEDLGYIGVKGSMGGVVRVY
ncbi:hypothetical protein [Viridibacillus arvi]|uniref:hypothetical protein n=1 Tax=Viridibacillus arvi TaxID=263475 RepID=UPI0034CD1628